MGFVLSSSHSVHIDATRCLVCARSCTTDNCCVTDTCDCTATRHAPHTFQSRARPGPSLRVSEMGFNLDLVPGSKVELVSQKDIMDPSAISNGEV